MVVGTRITAYFTNEKLKTWGHRTSPGPWLLEVNRSICETAGWRVPSSVDGSIDVGQRIAASPQISLAKKYSFLKSVVQFYNTIQ